MSAEPRRHLVPLRVEDGAAVVALAEALAHNRALAGRPDQLALVRLGEPLPTDVREVIVLASGESQAAALAALVASAPPVSVICDRAAAAALPPERSWESNEVLVVLGHRDPDSRQHRASHQSFGRLAVAVRLARRNPVRAVVLTGFTSTAGLSEAEQMAQEWDVPEVPVVLETAGTDTLGNAECSLPLIEALGGIERVTVVTSAWHLRARVYFSYYHARGYDLRLRYDWRHGPWLRMLLRELRFMPPRRARQSDPRSARTRRPA